MVSSPINNASVSGAAKQTVVRCNESPSMIALLKFFMMFVLQVDVLLAISSTNGSIYVFVLCSRRFLLTSMTHDV